MNILSFDIEEWYVEKIFHGGRKQRYEEFDHYLGSVLDVLDEQNIKGTFFCVGGMGREFPQVVKRIAEHGHEIGCHSDKHKWLTKLSQQETFEDTRMAVDSLEQCVGKKVLSYRAPAFSIGSQNKWALEILAECGIEHDASIFPAARDFGGFANFGQKTPTILKINGIELKEFPIYTKNVFGRDLAFSGGGYFRFFPLWFIEREIEKSNYSMTYFHIGDLLPESKGVMTRKAYEDYFKEPGTIVNRYKRYVKSNLGKKTSFAKLMKLIRHVKFQNIAQANVQIDWSTVPVVHL